MMVETMKDNPRFSLTCWLHALLWLTCGLCGQVAAQPGGFQDLLKDKLDAPAKAKAEKAETAPVAAKAAKPEAAKSKAPVKKPAKPKT